MNKRIYDILTSETIGASAPCRIDMGGTLDISSFYYPLAYLNPCTFNIAIGLRTRVRISPFKEGVVKVSSKGFESAEFPIEKMPFNHPMGLMFAIAGYFRFSGIHIHIESSSPPKSALGGSSSAAVALIAAFNELLKKLNRPVVPSDQIPLLAHAIEESVAGVPCGLQDQLAAFYGGINAWRWKGKGAPQLFIKQSVAHAEAYPDLSGHLLLAYCGIPHESKNINSIWIKQFLSGQYRSHWVEIINCTNEFVDTFSSANIHTAVKMLNRETGIRVEMTPDVLDDMGKKLVHSAFNHNCGARFTGAGGGGCIWAFGETEQIVKLKENWNNILSDNPAAGLLDLDIDSMGVKKG